MIVTATGRNLALLGIGAVLALALPVMQAPPEEVPAAGHIAALPEIMLWAWERPEDLRFIDTRAVGVAFLSRTCRLRGEEVIVRPRLQPLAVPHGSTLEAVVRIECDERDPPALSAGQMQELTRIIGQAARMPGVKAVQIDFDARRSQRVFYRELLHSVRRALPEGMPLSITALASWCMYDSWISGLPVDEVVPMVFRMGIDHDRVHSSLKEHKGLLYSGCRQSIGISADEPISGIPAGMRLYMFNPKRWSEEAFQSILNTTVRQ